MSHYAENMGPPKTVRRFQEVPNRTPVTVEDGESVVGLGWVEEVLITNDKYIVYLTTEDRPTYATWIPEPPGFNALWLKLASLHSAIRSRASVHEIREVSRQIGGALSLALEGETHVAHEFLDKIASSLEERRVSLARRKFSLATFITAAVCVIVGSLSIAYLTPYESADSENLKLLMLLELSLIGGAVGTFLATNSPSALRAEGSTTQDWPQTFQYGSMRTLYGIGSAFVLLLAVTSGVISSSLLGDEPTKTTLLLVACAAGFVDHWVRDVLTSVGGSKEDESIDPGSMVLDAKAKVEGGTAAVGKPDTAAKKGDAPSAAAQGTGTSDSGTSDAGESGDGNADPGDSKPAEATAKESSKPKKGAKEASKKKSK